jgi:hypothetical protein
MRVILIGNLSKYLAENLPKLGGGRKSANWFTRKSAFFQQVEVLKILHKFIFRELADSWRKAAPKLSHHLHKCIFGMFQLHIYGSLSLILSSYFYKSVSI